MAHIVIAGRYNVRPGDPAFVIATNACDYFELGAKEGKDYWLEGNIVGDCEFLFNGRLYLPQSNIYGTVIDNFPKGPAPNGWTIRKCGDPDGYELVSQDGTVLFAHKIEENLCIVVVNIYAADGELVAESLPDQFRIHRGPATIGHGGMRIG